MQVLRTEPEGTPAADTTIPNGTTTTTVTVPYTDPKFKEEVTALSKMVKNIAIVGGASVVIIGGISLYSLMAKPSK